MSGLFLSQSPEACGIPSRAVLDFLDNLERSEINIHGVCLMRGNQIFAEGYWKPFCKNTPHRMYSITKSFVSLAMGFLQEDRLIQLDDLICGYFPEKLSGPAHPFLAQTTIRHMLCMASPHWATTYKIADLDDWVKSYFVVEPTHRPGTLFSYDTSASLVLAALAEKLTGKKLLDYLRDKFLDRLDFSKEAYIIPDPVGVSQGGSGLVCTLEDIYKVAYICMNEGRLGDEQLIPADYLREAISKQIDTSFLPCIEERQGYGYMIWQSRHGGFTLYGMGGQLAVCFPKQKLIFATMADTILNPPDQQSLYEAFWTHIFPHVADSCGEWEAFPENPVLHKELLNRLENLQVPQAVKGEKDSPWAQKVQDKEYILEENPMGIESVSLHFEGRQFTVSYRNQRGEFTLPFTTEGQTTFSLPENPYDFLSFAAWTSPFALTLQVNISGPSLGMVRAQLAFQEDTVTVHMRRTSEDLVRDYNGNALGKVK